jgi:hypothetical protein
MVDTSGACSTTRFADTETSEILCGAGFFVAGFLAAGFFAEEAAGFLAAGFCTEVLGVSVLTKYSFSCCVTV